MTVTIGKEDDDSQYRWKRKAAATKSTVQDQYQKYCQEDPIDPYEPRADDLGIILGYWKDNEARWPDLARLACDALSIPAMSAECERCISSGKLTIPAQRAALGSDSVEACECQGYWLRRKHLDTFEAIGNFAGYPEDPLSTFSPSGAPYGLAVMTVMTITAPGASDWSSWHDLYDQGGRSGPAMVMPALRKTKHTKVTHRKGETQQGPSRFETLTLEELVTLIEQGKDKNGPWTNEDLVAIHSRMEHWQRVKDSLRSLKQGRDNDNEDDYTTPVKRIDIK
jgi:hypothetical protein